MTVEDEDLIYARSLQVENMTDNAVISDYARTNAAQGGTEVWVPRGGMTSCRIGDMTARELAVFAEILQGKGGAWLTLPFGTELKRRDQVVLMSTGEKWEVQALAPTGTWTTCVRAIVARV